VGEKIFTAPSQGGEEQEEETEDQNTKDTLPQFLPRSLNAIHPV
jgi:hypothetical protein